MEMLYGGAGKVIWPGDETTSVIFPVVIECHSIPNDELIKIY